MVARRERLQSDDGGIKGVKKGGITGGMNFSKPL